jgi:TolB-like protein
MPMLTLALLVLLLPAASHIVRAQPCPDGSAPPCRTRVAVLPFRALDATDAQLAETLSAETSRALAVRGDLQVIPIGGTRIASAGDSRAPAQAVGADYLVDGLLGRTGSGVRLTVQVTDSRNETTLFANSYGCAADALSGFAARVARDVAQHAWPERGKSAVEPGDGPGRWISGLRWTRTTKVLAVYLLLLATTIILVLRKRTHWMSIVGVAIMPAYFLWVLWDVLRGPMGADRKP